MRRVGTLLSLGLAAAACGRTPVYGVGDGVGATGSADADVDYGTVVIRLREAPNVTADPFPGTARVSITLDYLDCLLDFHERNPSWSEGGAAGEHVFAAAEAPGGLCMDARVVDITCFDASISQGPEGLDQTVDYRVGDVRTGSTLAFGPLPSSEQASCPAGQEPIVRVASNDAVQGFDAAGNLLWEAISFDPDKAATDQGQPIEIRVGPP